MNVCRLLLALQLALMVTMVLASGAQTEGRYTESTSKGFDDVLQDLEFAIAEHNYRITGRNQIGEAISRRIGAPFPRNTVVHFCNLTTARKLLELAPDYLYHMPCSVALYEHEGKVVVETRLLPTGDPRIGDLALEINEILREIVRFAAESEW